ncbi:uncharacterized protein PHACADRAFT_262215 [Phanerochaete carnosa HHB-10118-sp]|uniref:Uncharacterized protein n=1 Tax=Phanerochaete carnosa (strain HHB-10118-sp) TaxID=650164 RepID=K5VKE1_PHACS|nr:uncharacterized protein PHACADRAFT_262215 [Phanerochaete carnosa HHB-10118-sp]EKM51838.1 hypothetical protein PHACADRAFT_262215 [Phanerochaete carnosa HHB-10118-sp]
MSRDVLSPLAGFSPLLSLQTGRQRRQARVPSPIVVPGYPVDEHAARIRSAQAPAGTSQSVRSSVPPTILAQAARPPPPSSAPAYSARLQQPARPAFPTVSPTPPTSISPPYHAAPPAVAAPHIQAAPYAQRVYNVPSSAGNATGPFMRAQPQTTFFVAPQVPQTSAAAPVFPPRPQSAPPCRPMLVPVDPSQVNGGDVIWFDGRPYDKATYARSLSPQMRIELAKQVVRDNPGRKVPFLKWQVQCKFGFDPDDYRDVARVIELSRPREPAVPPLSRVSPESRALILGEPQQQKCRNPFKRHPIKSYSCNNVDGFVDSENRSLDIYEDGWPRTTGSSAAVNPSVGPVLGQPVPSIVVVPQTGGYQLQPTVRSAHYQYRPA